MSTQERIRPSAIRLTLNSTRICGPNSWRAVLSRKPENMTLLRSPLLHCTHKHRRRSISRRTPDWFMPSSSHARASIHSAAMFSNKSGTRPKDVELVECVRTAAARSAANTLNDVANRSTCFPNRSLLFAPTIFGTTVRRRQKSGAQVPCQVENDDAFSYGSTCHQAQRKTSGRFGVWTVDEIYDGLSSLPHWRSAVLGTSLH